ncbi:MAG: hypothetical protein R3E12_12135 [Candidatus Eisenbacteria bacterium]
MSRGARSLRSGEGDLREAPAQFDWDGLGSGGTRVAAGRYLIRLEAHGAVVATGWVTVMQ